ncbi:glycosyltransferase [Acidocella sp. KAb 2-4]|uniref:glycosyltransferase n=1 Tax=Acidocella sp. KAb 2-4 TaxID=2885158 RepID=UPI001D06AA16|nr:glycosyltransferase [Acidocella sp. KAb 2-4]MCB5944211.1 hypothetical protein [Acidocella sp. KAb 2-4]
MLPETITNIIDGKDRIQALLSKHGTANFQINIEIANILKAEGHSFEASFFFDKAFQINPHSKEVLLAKMMALLDAHQICSAEDDERLKNLDENFYKFYRSYQISLNKSSNAKEILETLDACFESFRSGSEVDWLYIRTAMKLDNQNNSSNSNSRSVFTQDVIPRRLFFYWDKNPPREVLENIEYHKNLRYFDVVYFDRSSAINFLFENYGKHTAQLFESLRHPAEESDFFRLHALYALGGYYLDTDNQIISRELFQSQICSGSDSAVFILAHSGPF